MWNSLVLLSFTKFHSYLSPFLGYGHIAPATDAGRIITILYSIVGIPLCLIVLADLGKLFTKFLKFLWSFVRRFYYTGSCRKIRRTSPVRTLEEKLKNMDKRKEGETAAAPAEPQESNGHVVDADPGYVVDDDFNLPPFVAIAIVFIYIFLGALMYRQWENWTYLEAFYFIFISVSTIGFGDVLPEHPNYFLVSSLYVFIGLALVSMVINVLIEFFSKTLDEAKRKMEQVSKTIGISLDDGIEAETANVTTAQQTNAQLDPKAGKESAPVSSIETLVLTSTNVSKMIAKNPAPSTDTESLEDTIQDEIPSCIVHV